VAVGLRGEVPRRHGVDCDAARPQFGGQGTGQGVQPAFGGGVGHVARARDRAGDRGDVDDAATDGIGPALGHEARCLAGQLQRGHQVDVEQAADVVQRKIIQGTPVALAHVVDQDVQRAVALLQFRQRTAELVGLSDVEDGRVGQMAL